MTTGDAPTVDSSLDELRRENAELRRELEGLQALSDAAQRLAVLQSITTQIASTVTLTEIARVMTNSTAPAVGAAFASLYVLDESGLVAHRVGPSGQPRALHDLFATVRLDEDSSLATALREHRPDFVRASDYAAHHPNVAAALRAAGIPPLTVASFPLVARERTLGGLRLAFTHDRTPDPNEKSFLVTVAEHCAQAVHRARLYADERRAVADAALLYELLDEINTARTLEDVYSVGLDTLRRAVGLERASILLVDAGGAMRFSAWRGLSDEYRRRVDGHSPWSVTDPDPQPLLIQDTTQDARAAAYREIFDRENIRALAFIPLVAEERLLGKFMVYSDVPRTFAAAEVRLMETIATQLAAAVVRKNAEQALMAARTDAERANRTKDEFLAVVSHELRTPLATIAGWVALLRKSTAAGDLLGKGLDVIERAVRAQSTIVEDILDVSRIVTGNFVLERRPVDFSAVAAEAVESSRTSAAAKHVTVKLDVSSESMVVIGDSDRLRQTIWNLLSNAIKFSSEGGVVTVELRRSGPSIVLCVRDTGAGIAPEFLPFVFDRFRQQDSSSTRRHAGLGLGLAIVRRLVELHDGEVSADSEGLGKGATFTVKVPAAAVHAERAKAEQPARAERLDGVRVLVVEDDADTRDVVARLLSTQGATVVGADSVASALEALRRSKPDVLVSDIGMPDESGLSLARRLRTEIPGGAEIPAIALTAYARTQDERSALDAGFDRYVSKPAPPDVLTRVVHELVEAKRHDTHRAV